MNVQEISDKADALPSEQKEKIAFLLQVRRMSREEFSSRPLGMPALKNEGMIIRSADFWGVDPNGYDLFSSDEERIAMLDEYGID